MGLTVLKKKSGYAMGLLLCAIGLVILLITIWHLYQVNALASISSISAGMMDEELTLLGLSTGFKLVHSTLVGVILIVAGGTVLAVRREKIHVVEEVNVLLECAHCKGQWTETISQSQLDSMGYPNVRTLSRHKCPKCAKFTRPKILKTER